MLNRRQFLKLSAVTGAGLLLPWHLSARRAMADEPGEQAPLPGSAIAQFVDPLPSLHTIIAGSAQITLRMREFQSPVMPSTFVPASGAYAGTWVWGYRQAGQTATSFIGPVIVATRGVPTEIKFVNELGDGATSQLLFWKNATDQTLHWADPLDSGMIRDHYAGPIPAVVHLHGGDVPPVLDGGPDAWYTSDGNHHGHAYYSKAGAATNEAIYRYPNGQEASMIWFHDHVLGATRLNVYAGLAGAYPIIDPNLQLPNGLLPLGLQKPGGLEPIIPLVIQDRMFDTNGQLFFPSGLPYIPNPEHPFWVPEFVGDTIVVNGKVWPYLNVEPRRYRFLFINGSNARTYELFLTNPATKADGPAVWQIGTDGGYLDAPVKIDPSGPKGQMQRLVLMPGERADVIIDFAGQAPGTTLLLRNIAKTPYPDGETPNGNTLGRVVQFRIVPATAADTSYNPASGVALRSGSQRIVRLVNPAAGTLAGGVTVQVKRQLTLNEVLGEPTSVDVDDYPGGPLEILVNNTRWDGMSTRTYNDFTAITVGGNATYYSELPHEGDTELWEIVNLTADAHPIHTHLTQFQLMNRQNFDVRKYDEAYELAFPSHSYEPGFGPPLNYNIPNAENAVGGNPAVEPFLHGPAMPPAPNEAGWKDTVQVLPGQVTRIVVRYAPDDKPVNAPDLYYPFNPDGGHGYVWHCHIIDHEDNEMMRPFTVVAKNVARTYNQGTDY